MYKPPIKPKGQLRKSAPNEPSKVQVISDSGSALFATELNRIKDDAAKSVDKVVEHAEKILDKKVEEIDKTLEDIENTAVEVIKNLASVEVLKGEKGKDADEEAIVKKVLSKIPTREEIISEITIRIPKPLDEKALIDRVASKMPQSKASLKVIQEKFEIDPMSVIDKIMALPEEKRKKLKLSSHNIDGLEQTISAFRNQLARGYLHGGGGGSGSVSITGGTGITVTGTGTTTDPYVISQYTAPTISLSTTPAAGVQEIGSTIASTVLNATTVKNSSNITGVVFYKNASLLHTQASPLPNGGLESYTDSTPNTTNTSYYVTVTDGTTTVTSNTATFTFVYPYLYGINSPALSFGSMYGSLTHLIAAQGTKTTSFAPNSQVMYFGYPASYPDLTSIKDQNNFETISNWTKRTGNITGLDGNPVSYKVYEFNNLTGSGTTISYTFA